MKRYFIITIDTEGDNLWKPVIGPNGMRNISVKNADYIERFQRLCEKYHFVPSYLVNYEMATAYPFAKMAGEWVKDNRCEIGMHLHAWNTPPIFELKYKKGINNPYACEYPHRILKEKIKVMTGLLHDQFGVRPTSHRGGRWYIDTWYLQVLKKLDYLVDCSVTPGISWKNHIGYERYGRDYSKYPNKAYYMDEKYPFKEKAYGILEVPPTIMDTSLIEKVKGVIESPFSCQKIVSQKKWLRPNGNNLDDMLSIVNKYKKANCDYIEFMMHSSELMPGGSPTFRDKKSIEKMYAHLEILFETIENSYKGISLSEYAKERNKHRDGNPMVNRRYGN